MSNSRELKNEYKRLKQQAKRQMTLQARLASVEMEMGKLKAARSRLRKVLERSPESGSARSLYAECLSRLGDHEESLKQWEEMIYAEPFNTRARSGYIRELAFMDRNEQLADAIADLYGLDPFEDQISDRHQEALLRSMRSIDPSIRVWNPQWHPGDFTSIGTSTKLVAETLDLTPRREPLPDHVQPQLDGPLVDRLTMELKEVRHATQKADTSEMSVDVAEVSEAPATDGEPVSDEERALAALLEDDGETAEATATDSELDLDEELEVEVDPDSSEAEIVLDDSDEQELKPAVAEEAAGEPEVAEAEETDEAEPQGEEIQTEEAPDEEADEEEVEAELEEEVSEEEPEIVVNPLFSALDAAGVEHDDLFDIEQLAEDMREMPPYIVEEPDVRVRPEDRVKKPVDVMKGKKVQKASEVAEEEVKKPEITSTPSIDVSVEMELQEAGKDLPDDDIAAEELSTELDQDTLDDVLGPETDEPVTPADLVPETDSAAPEQEVDDEEFSGSLDQAMLDKLMTKQAGKAAPDTSPASTPPADEPVEEDSRAPMSQDDLDALIAAKAAKPAAPAAPPETKPEPKQAEPESGGTMSQDDLDALIAAKAAKPAAPAAPPETKPEPKKAEPESGGTMSQDDLDALIAAKAAKPAAPAVPPETKPEPKPAEPESGGTMSQDDLDALIAAKAPKPATPAAPPETKPEPKQAEPESGGTMSQDDLDALIAAKAAKPAAPAAPPETKPAQEQIEPESESAVDSVSQADLDGILNSGKSRGLPQEAGVKEISRADLTQDALDEIMASKAGPPPDYVQPIDQDDGEDEEDEDDTPLFISEPLEGEFDQSLLDELYAPKVPEPDVTEQKALESPHQDLAPGEEISQKMLDGLFDAEHGPAAEDSEESSGHKDISKLFDETTDLQDAARKSGLTVSSENYRSVRGTPTLEDMQRKLDDLELNEGQKESSIDDDEPELPGTFDIGSILKPRAEFEAELAGESPTDPEAPTESGDELPAVELEAEELPEIDLKSELPEPEIDEKEYDALTQLEAASTSASAIREQEPSIEDVSTESLPGTEPGKPEKTEMSATAFAEAVRQAPPLPRLPRPKPLRSLASEQEIPPEEFKGPVTKTFARLCLAQGKGDHAAYVLNQLLEDQPDDPELTELLEKARDLTGRE